MSDTIKLGQVARSIQLVCDGDDTQVALLNVTQAPDLVLRSSSSLACGGTIARSCEDASISPAAFNTPPDGLARGNTITQSRSDDSLPLVSSKAPLPPSNDDSPDNRNLLATTTPAENLPKAKRIRPLIPKTKRT